MKQAEMMRMEKNIVMFQSGKELYKLLVCVQVKHYILLIVILTSHLMKIQFQAFIVPRGLMLLSCKQIHQLQDTVILLTMDPINSRS